LQHMGGVSLASSRGTQNGPDVTDVSALILAIQELHQAHVVVVMCPDGKFGSGGLILEAAASRASTTSGGAGRSVSRSVPFPNRNSKTLEGALFKLLHELDSDCTQMLWEQGKLPIA